MIKIKTEFDFETDDVIVKNYKIKNTCTMEHIGLITFLIKSIKSNCELLDIPMSTEEIFELVKEMEEENE